MKNVLKWLLEGFVDFFSDKTSTDVGIFQSFVGGILGITICLGILFLIVFSVGKIADLTQYVNLKKHELKMKKNERYRSFLLPILPTDATLNVFRCVKRDFIVEIEFQGETHTFTTDKNGIYHNGIQVCDSSYHYLGKEDTFSKLMNVIKDEIC